MKEILILTHKKDDCASMVIDHLNKSGASSIRFNTEDFQSSIKLTLKLDNNFNGTFHFPDKDLNFNNIGVVWNRRVHDPKIKDSHEHHPEILEWIIEESKGALNCAFSMLSCPVVNPWVYNERTKANKWIQMQKALDLGLKIPESCITNKTEEIKDFWDYVNKEMIFKKIRKGLLFMEDDKKLLIHTNKIEESWFCDENIERMKFCPVFLQKSIPKKYDIRSVIVGDEIFSVAIHSQEIPGAINDYRTAFVTNQLDNMRHEIIDLGDEINNKLIAYTRHFNLEFNTIDLIETPDDEIVFLENNANGQWGWLELKTGIQISKAFAENLVNLIV